MMVVVVMMLATGLGNRPRERSASLAKCSMPPKKAGQITHDHGNRYTEKKVVPDENNLKTTLFDATVSLEKRAEATHAEYRRQKASGSGGREFRLSLW